MRILVPSIVDPEVARGGAWTATRGLLHLLRQGPWQAQIECVATVERSAALHHLRQAACAVTSMVSSLPSKALFVHSRHTLGKVRRLLRETEFDLILLNGSDLLWMLPEMPPSVPRVLIAHNIEHLLYSSQLESVAPRWRFVRRLLARDLLRLREYELAGWREVENIIFLSSVDAETAHRVCPKVNSLVVPPVFDYVPGRRSVSREPSSTLEVGFMANFGWWPNKEGLNWFLDSVFPAINSRTRLHLFGAQSDRVVPDHPQVVKHGFVPKLEEVWDQCDLMICPVSSGGGVCVKVAEAIYNGMPTLSTSFGARGLPLQPDPGIVLLDRAEDWIRFLCSPQAQKLRMQRVPEHCARPFTMERNTAGVHDFLAEILSSYTRRKVS